MLLSQDYPYIKSIAHYSELVIHEIILLSRDSLSDKRYY